MSKWSSNLLKDGKWKEKRKTIVIASVAPKVSRKNKKKSTGKKRSEDSIKVLNLVKTPYAEFSHALLNWYDEFRMVLLYLIRLRIEIISDSFFSVQRL